MPCILLMSSLTTSTKQIMEESITWFSTLRLLAMQSMLVNCFHWHRRQQTWLGTGSFFRSILADHVTMADPKSLFLIYFGIGILVWVITIHYSSWLVVHDHYSWKALWIKPSTYEISKKLAHYKSPNLVILVCSRFTSPRKSWHFWKLHVRRPCCHFPKMTDILNDPHVNCKNNDVNLTSIAKINRNFLGIHPDFMGIFPWKSSIKRGGKSRFANCGTSTRTTVKKRTWRDSTTCIITFTGVVQLEYAVAICIFLWGKHCFWFVSMI